MFLARARILRRPIPAGLARFCTPSWKKPTRLFSAMASKRAIFTYIDNVVQANLLACEAPAASGKVINIGTGARISLNRHCNFCAKSAATICRRNTSRLATVIFATRKLTSR